MWLPATALLALSCAQAQAQAPWPQADGDSLHTRRSAAAWPRGSNATDALVTRVSSVPLTTPLLIGPGALYAGAADGLVYAFSPAGVTLWTLPGLDTAQLFALNDRGSRLFSRASGQLAIFDVTGAAPRALPAPLSLGGSAWLRGDLLLQAGLNPLDPHSVLVTCWNATASARTWVAQLPVGSVYSPPPIIGGIVGPSTLYIVGPTCASLAGTVELFDYNVTALDLGTGQVLWAVASLPFFDVNDNVFSPIAATSDCLVLGRLTFTQELYMQAHDARTGATLWVQPIAPSSTSENILQAGFAVHDQSLLSFNTRLILATGELQALPVPNLASLYGRVALLDASGALFFIYPSASTGSLDVYAYDTGTGQRLVKDDPLTVPGTGGNLAMDGEGNLFLGALGSGIYALSAGLASPTPSLAPSASPSATPSGTPSPSPSGAPAPPASASPAPPASASAPPPPPGAAAAAPSALAPPAWAAIGAALGALATLGALCALPAVRALLLSYLGAGAGAPPPQPAAEILLGSVNRATYAFAAD